MISEEWIKTAKVKGYLQINGYKMYLYDIYQNAKIVEENILGWRTALAHARKWQSNLFEYVNRVEILNSITGEIITIEEAEERAKNYKKRSIH